MNIDDAINLYEQGHTLKAIADKMGCSSKLMSNKLKERGIKVINKGNKGQIKPFEIIKWNGKQERDMLIINLYRDGKSSPIISKSLGISKRTVLRILKDNNINRQNKYATHEDIVMQNLNDIMTLYKSMSSVQIGLKYNINPDVIRKCLREQGIQVRSSSQAIGMKSKKLSMSAISEAYHSGKSCNEIGRKFEVHGETIRNKMKKAGTIRRNYSESNIEKYNDREWKFDIDSPEGAYWLGFLVADATIPSNRNRISVSLQYRDREHLESFLEFMGASDDLKVKHKHCATKDGKRIYLKSMVNIGSTFVVGEVMEIIKKIRHGNFQHIPRSNLCHFFRGYYDGDGIFTITNHKTGKINSLSSLIIQDHQAESFTDQLKRLGFTSRFRNHKSSPIAFLDIRMSDQLRFLKTIYDNSSVNLTRKYERFIELKHIKQFKNRQMHYAYDKTPDQWKYPYWSNEELMKDISDLVDWTPDLKYVNSRRLEYGTKVIKHFNTNFWHSCPHKSRPIIEVFSNKKTLDRFIEMSNNTFYNVLGKLKYCSQYRYPSLMSPQLSLNIAQNLIPEGAKIYDPCAGWGSRFLSFYSRNYEYSCAEPNPLTRAGLRLIASWLQTNIKLYDRRLEDGPPPRVKADVIWTSPSFGVENYNGGPGISATDAVKHILSIAYYLLPRYGKVILHIPTCKMSLSPNYVFPIEDNYGGKLVVWEMKNIKKNYVPLY